MSLPDSSIDIQDVETALQSANLGSDGDPPSLLKADKQKGRNKYYFFNPELLFVLF